MHAHLQKNTNIHTNQSHSAVNLLLLLLLLLYYSIQVTRSFCHSLCTLVFFSGPFFTLTDLLFFVCLLILSFIFKMRSANLSNNKHHSFTSTAKWQMIKKREERLSRVLYTVCFVFFLICFFFCFIWFGEIDAFLIGFSFVTNLCDLSLATGFAIAILCACVHVCEWWTNANWMHTLGFSMTTGRNDAETKKEKKNQQQIRTVNGVINAILKSLYFVLLALCIHPTYART